MAFWWVDCLFMIRLSWLSFLSLLGNLKYSVQIITFGTTQFWLSVQVILRRISCQLFLTSFSPRTYDSRVPPLYRASINSLWLKFSLPVSFIYATAWKRPNIIFPHASPIPTTAQPSRIPPFFSTYQKTAKLTHTIVITASIITTLVQETHSWIRSPYPSRSVDSLSRTSGPLTLFGIRGWWWGAFGAWCGCLKKCPALSLELVGWWLRGRNSLLMIVAVVLGCLCCWCWCLFPSIRGIIFATKLRTGIRISPYLDEFNRGYTNADVCLIRGFWCTILRPKLEIQPCRMPKPESAWLDRSTESDYQNSHCMLDSFIE